ncbi:MAG: ATP-dependent DNA helicase RecG [Clostridia bacterium]|nr:ATP-dependent DNA helicase RecG [Clostridia bacterium]
MKNDIYEILKKPVRTLKGVGEARAKLFQRLNIYTVYDLITHFPREYEDRGKLKSIVELVDGEAQAFEGTIAAPVSESRLRRGLSVFKVSVRDESGTITATWFNQHYIKNVFKVGEKYIFYGKVSRKYKSFEIQSPVYEKHDKAEMKNTCRIVPVYPSTASLSQNIIRNCISSALESVLGSLEDILPQWVRNQYYLSEINYALEHIHFPKGEEDFKNARTRLVFEELLLLQLGLLSIKSSFIEVKKGILFRPVSDLQHFLDSLPFKLTNAQRRVLSEIEEDMESDRVMNRLVQGDVGSGKTAVAVLALFKAVKNGFQGTLMVPTEILAEQHFRTVKALLERFDIRVSLLTGSQTKKQKDEILEEIRSGKTDVVIGTHALIEDTVIFDRLGLVITDEQHRFGVRQRAALSKKGDNPDIIVMTATPIPRTLALILYGDLDISVIDELPPGRKPIETYAVDNSMRERVNQFIRTKVSEGRQVYIVCPLVEESEAIEAKSAVETSERIALHDFKDLQVALIHGKMKAKEKEAIMQGFIKGEVHILVSTTVIEVGVNVPNATVMVIENAERFGLAQLHQLRGRVGRGEHQSYCILYNEGNSKVSRERMKVMQKTNDGFVISEKDLELRGPGEFFGTRQHGIPELKIANLYRDLDILKQSQEAAGMILAKDRHLKQDENIKLKEKITERFKDKMNEISFN